MEIHFKEGDALFYREWWDMHFIKPGFSITSKEIAMFQIYLIKDRLSRTLDNNDIVDQMIENIENTLSTKARYYYLSSQEFDGEVYKFRCIWTISSGENVFVIRRIPKKLPTVKDIWIDDSVVAHIKNYKKGGFVLFTAPPGSWKSTSIAAICDEFFKEKTLKVVTLEDPKEYTYTDTISFVEQREKWIDFGEYMDWIDAALKQTPDILILQEITTPDVTRDIFTLIKKACLVVSTMHTIDVVKAFTSILNDFSVEERSKVIHDLNEYFKCIVSQRLIPRKDNPKKMVAVFEIIHNTPEVRGKLLSENIDWLATLLDYPPNLSFATDIYNKIQCWLISEEDGKKYCPESRIHLLEKKLNWWY